jgi:23S rRNA (cytidine1920-2'-O)/16S rRNA (cytidine1409-2'-O)-methyltransferase
MKVELNNLRVDVALVERGLARTRSLAVRLIDAGQVYLGNKQVAKPSMLVSPADELIVEDGEANRFVSRGGLKLLSALEYFGVDVDGWRCLDVGISTGGFSDCLLQRGASEVVGLDVGHDQLAPKLRDDSRLVVYEGVNARNLTSFAWLDPFDLIVVDVSFISLTKVLPEVVKFLRPRKDWAGQLLVLVKPQFELGGRVVRTDEDFSPLMDNMISVFENLGLEVSGQFECPIRGGDGNKEFFIYAQKVTN